MTKKASTSSLKRPPVKRWWIAAALVVVIVLAVFFGQRYLRHQMPSANNSDISHPPTAVTPAPSSGNETREQSSASSNINQGGATDQNGQTPSAPSASQWTTSQSGSLVLKSPAKDSTFKSGDNIFGTAPNSVQFRLIDNKVGVIAQGTINVVGGKFSATASFKSYASSGRLDVFNTDSNGKEINEVQVPVSF